jgi:hypothetical protein
LRTTSKLIACLFLEILLLSGCATTGQKVEKNIAVTPSSHTALDSEIETAVIEMLGRLPTQVKDGRFVVLHEEVAAVSANDMSEHLFDAINSFLKLHNAHGGKPIGPLTVTKNMYDLNLKSSADDIAHNAKTWEDMGAKLLILYSWSDDNNSDITIAIKAYDIKNGGHEIAVSRRNIAKDDQIRKLLGEKLPGSLTVKSPDLNATLYCDNVFCGEIGKEGKTVEIKYGGHSIKVDKSGYKSFYKDIEINERENKYLNVGFVSANSALPIAFLSNAVIPMSASWIYGPRLGVTKHSVQLNTISALIFYIAAGMYIVDMNQKGYLTKDSKNRAETWKSIELISAAGSYGVCLISGFMVGAQYMNDNKRGIELTASPPSLPYLLSFQHTANKNNMVVLSFQF